MPNTREFEVNPRKFANFIDSQSGEDSVFQIRNHILWTKFVHSQEDRLRENAEAVKFTLAEATGLQIQNMVWDQNGRESERYVFDHHTMLNCQGKKLSPVDCVFYPSLSMKKDAMPVLKPIRLVYLK